MSDIAAPVAPSGGGQAAPPTPSNFSSNMAAKNASGSTDANVLQPLTQRVADRFNKPATPMTDGSTFEGGQGRALERQDGNELAAPDPNAPVQEPGNELPPDPLEQQARADALAQKMLEGMSTGILPEEALDLVVKVPWGQGGTKEVPIRELIQGNMRQSDYTKAKTEIRAHADRLQQIESGLNNTIARFQQPETMFETLIDLGFRKQMQGMAKLVFKQWVEQEQVARALPAERQAAYRASIERQFELEDNQRAMTRKQAQLEQRNKQTVSQEQQHQNALHIQNQINQLRPLSFKAMGIQDAPYHRQVFENQLVAVIRESGRPFDGQITREEAWKAAQITREILEDDQASALANSQQQQPGQQQQPMSPLRLSPGANAPGSQQSRQAGQRRRPSQLDNDLRQRGGRAPGW